jgi:hypothetical protein
MRSYVYVSDAKLDQLAPQVPKKLRERVAAELTVGISIFNLSLKEQPHETTRYAKLELVRQHLLKQGELGTLLSDDPWFEGEMSMHWGPFLHHEPSLSGEHDRDYDPQFPMIFFAGASATTRLGLGGSRRHVLGEENSLPEGARTANRDRPLFTSYSEGFPILTAIKEALPKDQKVSSEETGVPAEERRKKKMANAVRMVVDGVVDLSEKADLPPTPVEFVALRLADVEERRVHGDQRVILGTPLYVARATPKDA